MTTKPPKSNCPTGKRRYVDNIAALMRLAEILRSGEEREKMPRRAYRCPMCRGWHLTSQPPRVRESA